MNLLIFIKESLIHGHQQLIKGNEIKLKDKISLIIIFDMLKIFLTIRFWLYKYSQISDSKFRC